MHPAPCRQTKAREALKREPVFDLELRSLVRKRVERLEQRDLEHQHWVERRAYALAAGAAPQRDDQWSAENFKLDHRGQSLQPIARGAQRLGPVRKIEKTRLFRQLCLAATVSTESSRAVTRYRFLKVSQGPGWSRHPCRVPRGTPRAALTPKSTVLRGVQLREKGDDAYQSGFSASRDLAVGPKFQNANEWALALVEDAIVIVCQLMIKGKPRVSVLERASRLSSGFQPRYRDPGAIESLASGASACPSCAG